MSGWSWRGVYKDAADPRTAGSLPAEQQIFSLITWPANEPHMLMDIGSSHSRKTAVTVPSRAAIVRRTAV